MQGCQTASSYMKCLKIWGQGLNDLKIPWTDEDCKSEPEFHKTSWGTHLTHWPRNNLMVIVVIEDIKIEEYFTYYDMMIDWFGHVDGDPTLGQDDGPLTWLVEKSSTQRHNFFIIHYQIRELIKF